MKKCRVAGIDLAGVPHNPSGICLFNDKWNAKTFLLYSDEDILACLDKEKPEVVAIDAPLTLPPGRKSIEERNAMHLRLCDRELKKRKIPFFPITLGPMRTLTARGISLKETLEKKNLQVIEIYPGGAQDIWKIPRAGRDLAGLKAGLRNLGIRGIKENTTGDELDAVTAALVGFLFLHGKAEIYGNWAEGAIVMPSGIPLCSFASSGPRHGRN
ncbi:MAG: DUF429 domain-containing protein [Candidatus Aminicenantes bacterium]|nr:DUF429 domain-containing protein [Candidatus Aminicenantes bacterium]